MYNNVESRRTIACRVGDGTTGQRSTRGKQRRPAACALSLRRRRRVAELARAAPALRCRERRSACVARLEPAERAEGRGARELGVVRERERVEVGGELGRERARERVAIEVQLP